MSAQITKCPNCSTENSGFEAFCRTCGNMLPASYQNPMQPHQGAGMQAPPIPGADKKVLAGVLGIVLGGLGIHKFVLGYTTEGVIMLVVSLLGWFLCGIPSIVMAIIGIVEGIMYLTKSDQEFVQTYVVNKKSWF